MKAILVVVVSMMFLAANLAPAEEANGLRVTAQKTQLEKGKDKDAFYEWDKVEKALGLKVAAKNVSFKDLPEGTIEYTVLVKRWGQTPDLIHNYSGTEKLAALKAGAEANLIVGKVPLGGWEIGGNRKQFSDSIEGWQIVVKHDGKETIKLTSTGSFEKYLKIAKPGPKPK